MNLSNISIDDESVKLLSSKIGKIKMCDRINLNGNNISFSMLKSLCEKTLEKKNYPSIEMKCYIKTNEELNYYLLYLVEKNNFGEYDFSSITLTFLYCL